MELSRRALLAGAGALAFPGAAPARIIDTHTHFYDPSRPQGVPWPGKNDALLYRTVLPKDFREVTKGLGVTGTVVVEASPWLEDNQWILDLAKDDPSITGLVGHIEPGTPEFRDNLARFSGNRLFLGIRVGGGPLAKGVGQAAFIDDMKRLAAANLEVDLLGGASMFPHILKLSDQVPGLRIVIDHLPFEKQDGLKELQGRTRVYAKVSNVFKDLTSYRGAVDEVWSVFGEDRVVYGSNWPVSARVIPYPAMLKLLAEYFTARGAQVAEKYFWKNALAAYRWVERS